MSDSPRHVRYHFKKIHEKFILKLSKNTRRRYDVILDDKQSRILVGMVVTFKPTAADVFLSFSFFRFFAALIQKRPCQSSRGVVARYQIPHKHPFHSDLAIDWQRLACKANRRP